MGTVVVVGAVVVAAGRSIEPVRPDLSPELPLHAAIPPLARSDTSTATAARRTSGERSDLVLQLAQTCRNAKHITQELPDPSTHSSHTLGLVLSVATALSAQRLACAALLSSC